MDSKSPYDAEKGIQPVRDSDSGNERGHVHDLVGRKSSVAESVIAAGLLDERYATTQRGLKSRHAQMIALGGTIGTGYVLLHPSRRDLALTQLQNEHCADSFPVSLSVLVRLCPAAAQLLSSSDISS
jgi:hypothetical protein